MKALIGQAEGHARKGEWDGVRGPLARLRDEPESLLRAQLALAEVGPDGNAFLKAAVENPDATASPWLLLRLIDLGTKAGLPEETLLAVAKKIPDAALRGRGQLLIFRAKLAQSKEAGDEKAAEAVEPKTLSALLAKQALARHNTRRDSGFAKTVQTWEESAKAFGAAGVILGLRGDEEKKR
jgi:hypothetical protein